MQNEKYNYTPELNKKNKPPNVLRSYFFSRNDELLRHRVKTSEHQQLIVL